ncbi:MAG: DEAD/DEAH box helicase family protein [Candidatus Poribacteria bacterium]|nr:DEAD/DEAH box helicase family protein [Candidatus Poribacteria bacterium]
MSEATQGYFTLGGESEQTNPGFQSVLNYIREKAQSERQKGDLFEQLMQKYFTEDPDYKEQFSEVYLWKQWAELQTEFDGTDIGVDLVAEKQDGEFCAIQCKCYAEDTRVSKPHLDSFISASASQIFTSRIFVNTGGELGENALRAITPLGDKFRIIRFSDLESSPFDWPDLSLQDPAELTYKQRRFHLKDHQKEAFDDVMNGFKASDRGKLIMACGTGKTFTTLKIAEEIAGPEGRVLYLVPSISLLSQAMREWSEQRAIDHSYIGVCSDTRVGGSTSEDASVQELKIPVTTDPLKISLALQNLDSRKMTVVFCTYQSLPVIEEVQKGEGVPPFDIIFCDEAHRTTGVEAPEDKTSPFVLVHDADRIRANKRLYMTATPRIYTEGARATAVQHDRDVFSMDDLNTYGPEFYHLPFSKAVELGELSDYRVVVLAISEGEVNTALRGDTREINVNDATKIVGCWRALQNPERKAIDDPSIKPLKRVIAFTNRISESKRMVQHWNDIIEGAIERLPEDEQLIDFKCETKHVDGTVHALNRRERLNWLKGDSDGECRILSNARCLSEGIDVPALDAVLFMTSRKSYVDIVQAVGRVMRRAPGKQYGYIVLPVAIPDGVDPADALDDNERFSTVWGVLRALRSHDDRLNAEINKIDLNRTLPERLIFGGIGGDGESEGGAPSAYQMFLPLDIPPAAILPKIVEKCGDKKYWESWAKDVAEIFGRIVGRVENLLENPENDALQERFDAFYTELRRSINESITRSNAIDMMAQHILTKPVFDALFEGYDFSSGNPVAGALDNLRKDFAKFGLENETRDLEGFYESVRLRARGIDNSEGRQKVLSELYENFFVTALRKEADRLGIVYTPVEVVDFILHSVDAILRDEFGRSLNDEGVQVLDPFTGTGTFLARLLQSELIASDDLERKYREELHANELVLLAYYIAAVNIEEVFRGRRGEDNGYEPFNGIVLTDTFNLNKEENPTLFPREWLPDNNERAERQQQLPIQVIVGNPPWSTGQRSASDDNPNVEYPELEGRIRETYASRVEATLKNSLYDTYKMAIRWASDRTSEQGVVAFVTNGSWIDGNVDSGVRACLAEEFSSIHVLHLRGNARTSGERRRAEGGNVFGGGSRAPVAITILVKNPNATHDGCEIHYHDIGDCLTCDRKLEVLREAVSIKGFDDWQAITPNSHHDWIDHRSDAYTEFYPIGSQDARAGRTDNVIFKLFSTGYLTGRDAYIYNFSSDACAQNAEKMTRNYLDALSELQENPEFTVDEVVDRHNSHIKWDGDMKKKLGQRRETEFDEKYIRKIVYRPFVAANCYANDIFIQRKGQLDQIFPVSSSENRVICVPNKGSRNPFSVLMANTMPDRHFIEAAQCFPRWRYPAPEDASNTENVNQFFAPVLDRIDNISDTALGAFSTHYGIKKITKDEIFDYVYGILHAPSYREQFANDLSKMIPRIPFAPDFYAFVEAGAILSYLHLNYETCEQYPGIEVEPITPSLLWEEKPEHFLFGTRAMRFADAEKTTLIINEHVQLSGIPEAAHRYVVNGRTPLEWFIDRYKIKQDRESGIINDPNGWFENPRDLITVIERIIYISVESTKIIEKLPAKITDD